MDEASVQKMINDAIQASLNKGAFGVQLQSSHTHDGINSSKIDQNNLINATTIAASGSTALTGPVIFAAGTGMTVTESGQTITYATTAATTNIYGDGSDGVGTFDGSATPAGTSKSGSAYTLTRDVYYTSATLSGTSTIDPAGYQIFVSGTLTIGSGCKIFRNGNTGSNATDYHGAAGGTALSAGTLPGSLAGTVGGDGGQGGNTSNGFDAGAATAGTNASPSIGSSGNVGTSNVGNGGTAGAFAGGAGLASGGAAGTATLALNNPHTLNGALIHADLLSGFTRHVGSATNGGSSGGGGGASSVGLFGGIGGGAGGGGGNGGIIGVYASIIINNATPGIQAKGGTGGNGANGTAGSGGNQAGGGQGGSGGRGGQGGVIILVYHTLTQNGTFDVSGGTGGLKGTGGAGANGGGIGADGHDAGDGTAGITWQYIT